jgi:hypothetical protein
MSTDPKKSGHGGVQRPLHDDVSFETQDVKSSPIVKFLVFLGIVVVLSYFMVLGVYKGLTKYWASTYSQNPPSHQGSGPTMPPEPRLQGMPGHLTDPQEDWRNMLKVDTEANNQLGWVDEKAGVARIPVKDAMDLIVEKGLPALPLVPADKK